MAERRLTLFEKFSYGMGDFAFSLPWNMVGAFLLFYYTDVALLPAAAVGTLFLLARLFDAVVDIGVGIWVDRTRSRWGRTRPFFLYAGLPFAALMVLTFWVPAGLSVDARLVWAFITFNLLGLLFSLGSVPLAALLPMMTARTDERLQLSSWRAGATALSVILATAFAMPLVQALGAGNPRMGFAALAGVFAVISLMFSLNLFRTCREVHYDPTPATGAILPAVGRMLRNRAWLVTFAVASLNFVRFGAVLSNTPFFALEVLHAPWAISVLLPSVSGTLLLGAVIAPPILKLTGIRRGWLGSIAVALALYALLPGLEGQPALFVAVFVGSSLAISVTTTSIFMMAADCVDYHEWRFGVRGEGLLSSGISLATKVGMALGTAGVAYTLGMAGYHSGEMSQGVHQAIRWSYYIWPAVVLIAQAAAILFWPMDGDHARIRSDIAARTAAQGA
ncbi:MFS transporter [Novosphingobium rosa]|uniref:MFS transporter n=1 Tax=Novosphingobium rosa TaxID=76978 RepID=UPI000833CEFB|nr:glycoside-pentoside-hexuronide (GPH):cation symporter [Novosphingobium rosa]